MEIVQGIHTIREVLKNDKYDSLEKLKIIGWALPGEDEYKFHSCKDLILEQAKYSFSTKFRLVATMNSQISIFNWCDTEYNFLGMCKDTRYPGEHKCVVEYTEKELPDVIDNAENWLKGVKEGFGFSGSPYFISSLQLMGL